MLESVKALSNGYRNFLHLAANMVPDVGVKLTNAIDDLNRNRPIATQLEKRTRKDESFLFQRALRSVRSVFFWLFASCP